MSDELKRNLEELAKSPYASDPDNVQALKDWTEELRDVQLRSDYANHDVTKMISQKLRARINRFTQQLAFSDDLTEEQRRKIFESRKEDMWLLFILNPNTEAQMAALTEETKRAIEELE